MDVFPGLARLLPLLAALWFAPAQAAQLVPGGYGVVGSAPTADPFAFAGTVAPLVVDFTPRSSAALLLGSRALAGTDRADAADGGPEPFATLDRLGLATPSVGDSGFVVGGALRLDDLTLTASFARPTLLGTPSQLFAAGLSLGRVSATLGYATTLEPDSDPLDLLMLRTDLAALPWLSLESEMAIGASTPSGSLAVGRIGVRLNF